MACLRVKYNRMHIWGEHEFWCRFSVEKEVELVLGMCDYYATHRLAGEPSYSVETSGKQQACVDSYAHIYKVCR